METFILIAVFGFFGLMLALIFAKQLLGLVIINEREVGIVVKKFGTRLAAGQLIALKGEAGYQADTLPPGWHFFYFPWQFSVRKVPMTIIPQGQIGVVVAAAGSAIPSERILGKIVLCDNYQDTRKFLMNGGEKGRQLGILTAGTYRINTALFTVITANNAQQQGMAPELLQVYAVQPDRVGIVTTLDGKSIDEGEIAGPILYGHDNFQNAQVFLNQGGRRGLQEQVLLSGSWNLNPWFVSVEQVPMTQIPIGHVGIVIAFVGKAHEDVSGKGFKHGNLVEPGHKGVWVTPLYPGKHPLNSRVMKVELVPTTNIVLNWATRTESHNLDAKLAPVTVRSKDGFAFNLDVAQIIHIGAEDAPKVISRVGAVQNLVDHVLQPIVGNYFRNSAQEYTVLDFLSARSERQREATEHIRRAISAYDVQALDTLIGDITPPAELMKTQTDRKIAEEERKTYDVQKLAQDQRQELVRANALANIQQEMVTSEQGVQIAELKAQAVMKEAKGDAEATRLKALGEAEAIRTTGKARAEAYLVGVEALGVQGFTTLQMMQIIGERQVRIVPDVSVTGSDGAGLVESLLGMTLRNQVQGGQLLKENGGSSPRPQLSKTTE
ncbi:MAG: flotillin family protein [Chloroflexi bacterium]|nr:flotillin family protein [Chloroflexota bacterium]MBP8055537.1 flotillin family protein [Chloroflexota bacterium]